MGWPMDIAGKSLRDIEVAKQSAAWQMFMVGRGSQRAILCAQDHPAAYHAASNRTFISWLDQSRGLRVVHFDHSTNTFGRMRYLSDYAPGNPLYDDHGTPSMTIDNTGRIVIVFGDHGIGPYILRADEAGTADTTFTRTYFTSMAGTYHQIVSKGSALYVLFRAGGTHGATFPTHEFAAIGKSTDNGATFTVTPIVDTNAYNGTDAAKDFYPGSFDLAPNGRLAFSFCVAHGAAHDGTRSDVFHAQYDTTDGHMYTIGGTDLGTSIDTLTKFNQCKVATVTRSQVPRQAFKPDGKVMLHWVTEAGDGKIGTSVAYWNGSTWTVTDTGARTKHIQSTGAVRWDARDNRWEIFAATGRAAETIITGSTSEAITYGGIGCDFKLFTSTNGTNLTDRGIVAYSGDVQGVGINGIVVPTNSHRDLKALVQPGAIGNSSGSTPNNGSMIGTPLPFYALTDHLPDTSLLSRNPVGPIEMVLSPHIIKSEGAPGTTAGVWTQLAMGQNIPPNATHALISVSGWGTGSAGRWEIRLRQYGSAVDYNALAYGDGIDSNASSVGRSYMLWVPLAYRSFDWRWSGQLGGCAFRIIALRFDGPVTLAG